MQEGRHHPIQPRNRVKASILTPLICAAFILLAGPYTTAHAALVCYDLRSYPAAGALEQTEEGVRVTIVGGEYQETVEVESEYGADRTQTRSPIMEFNAEQGWEQVGFSDCQRSECLQQATQTCDHQTGEIGTGGATCADGPDKRYFGLSFYGGEGMDGTGGWGWYQENGERHTERPAVLDNASINTMVHDGTQLWVGTTQNLECTGQPPAEGLRAILTHPPENHPIVQPDTPYVRNETTETCGFVFHDMLLDGEDLWISSDMGVTRLSGNPDNPVRRDSTHYIPTGDPEEPMREVGCGELYRSLLSSLDNRGDVDPHPLFRPRDTLLRNLMKFRQRFMISYINQLQAGQQSRTEGAEGQP